MKELDSSVRFYTRIFSEFDLFWYGLLAVSTLMLLGIIYRTNQVGVHIPLAYGGHAIFMAESVKGILETRWALFNPVAGAPFSKFLVTFPMSEGLSFLIIRTIGLFTSDWTMAMNVFYFLTYILVATASFWAMRKMDVRPHKLSCVSRNWQIVICCSPRSFYYRNIFPCKN